MQQRRRAQRGSAGHRGVQPDPGRGRAQSRAKRHQNGPGHSGHICKTRSDGINVSLSGVVDRCLGLLVAHHSLNMEAFRGRFVSV